jgi:hypothetical protein
MNGEKVRCFEMLKFMKSYIEMFNKNPNLQAKSIYDVNIGRILINLIEQLIDKYVAQIQKTYDSFKECDEMTFRRLLCENHDKIKDEIFAFYANTKKQGDEYTINKYSLMLASSVENIRQNLFIRLEERNKFFVFYNNKIEKCEENMRKIQEKYESEIQSCAEEMEKVLKEKNSTQKESKDQIKKNKKDQNKEYEKSKMDIYHKMQESLEQIFVLRASVNDMKEEFKKLTENLNSFSDVHKLNKDLLEQKILAEEQELEKWQKFHENEAVRLDDIIHKISAKLESLCKNITIRRNCK